jgi:hypothetical protein
VSWVRVSGESSWCLIEFRQINSKEKKQVGDLRPFWLRSATSRVVIPGRARSALSRWLGFMGLGTPRCATWLRVYWLLFVFGWTGLYVARTARELKNTNPYN